MQPFNEKSKAHRTRVAEIIMNLASKEDGVLWEDLVGAVRAEFTVSNWVRIREVMQFLLNKGLINRTDNIHEERLVKASTQAKSAVDEDSEVATWLKNLGFKGKFKTDGSGVFLYQGIKVGISLGNENLYLTLPEIYSKDSHGEIIDALAHFLTTVHDLGGAEKP